MYMTDKNRTVTRPARKKPFCVRDATASSMGPSFYPLQGKHAFAQQLFFHTLEHRERIQLG